MNYTDLFSQKGLMCKSIILLQQFDVKIYISLTPDHTLTCNKRNMNNAYIHACVYIGGKVVRRQCTSIYTREIDWAIPDTNLL